MQNQVDALLALQGLNATERDLLDSPVVAKEFGPETMNTTYRLRLASGTWGYFKPIAGVEVNTAFSYGHEPDETILHEAAAWQLAQLVGAPVAQMVAPCVLRSIDGQPGALSLEAPGETWPAAYTIPVAQINAAAFFDCLIAQQDRHLGNALYSEAGGLRLIDHGYCFACTGDIDNWSEFVSLRLKHLDGPAIHGWERTALERLTASTELHGLAGALSEARAACLRARALNMLDRNAILDSGEF